MSSGRTHGSSGRHLRDRRSETDVYKRQEEIQIRIGKRGEGSKVGRKFRQKPVPDTKQAGTERLECIGIAGSGPSVGVTHFSLMTAAYLSGVLCRRTAVLEQNESGSFAQLEKIFRTGKRRKKPVIDGAGQPFEIRGIFFYQKAERAESVSYTHLSAVSLR